MPNYNFINNKTKEEWTQSMTWAERVKFLKENVDIEQTLSCPAIVADSVRIGINAKPDAGFRDVLKTIKKNNYGSNINTF